MNRQSDHKQAVPLDSQEGRRILGKRTKHPCPNPEHRGQGHSTLIFTKDKNGEPASRFTSGQVLFFACKGCDEESYQKCRPACPDTHRPQRYVAITHDTHTKTTVTTSHCRACPPAATNR